jgi:phospholipid/cholesterol/gamma-HCH transport system ATP-binding protein
MDMIKLSNINFSLNGDKILDNISLQIKKGDVAIILGPSGAGKSSILKIILGLWKPDSGSVEIEGIETANLSEREILPIRARIGVVFQGDALFDSLTVEENVGFFLHEQRKMKPREISKRVAEVLAFVNLSGTQNLYPDELSGGMKKRVAIARALASRPDIILYDEPTTGLDPINSKSILNLISRTKSRSATSVVVTHIINDAISIGDSLTLINDGKIVETGTVDDLLDSENKFVKDFFYEVFQDADLITHKHVADHESHLNG